MTPPSLTEQLANLPITDILWFVVVATAIRLGLISMKRLESRSVAEILESAVIAVVLVYLLIRPFVLQAYFIPSPSMVPTLFGENGSGDKILVNKWIYRFQNPHQHDIVVFIPPPNATDDSSDEPSEGPVNFIKRMIAGPGHTIVVTAGRIIINNHLVFSHNALREHLAALGKFGSDPTQDPQAEYHLKFTPDAVLLNGQPMSDADIAQMLTGQPDYGVKIVPGQTIVDGIVQNEPFTAEDPDYNMKLVGGEPLKSDDNPQMPYRYEGEAISKAQYDKYNLSNPEPVPPGMYFMMGDNRNDSRDSTEWGPLQRDKIVGKAFVIFWPASRIRVLH